MSVNILIVDDHPLLRKALRQVIEEQPGFNLVGEASSGPAALELARELKPELVLMDLHLPEMNGIEVARRIISAAPAVKVVMFSGDADRVQVDEALQAGACGYILKETAVDELVHAMEMVMAGKLYLSPEVSAGILEDYRRSLVGEPEPAKTLLTDREKQLLRLIAQGRRNKEIATHLGLRPKSVETYRARLMKRLGCGSSAELVRYAIREGILLP